NAGNIISIGNSTKIELAVQQQNAEPAAVPEVSPSETPSRSGNLSIGPIIAIAAAIFVISVSVVFALFVGLGSNKAEVANVSDFEDEPITNRNSKANSSPTPSGSATPSNGNSDVPSDITQPTLPDAPSGKKYAEMSETEKRSYVEAKAKRVAQVIGNASGEKIPSAALDRILRDVNSFATRTKASRLSGCRFGDNLAATYERASKNAPFIVRAFNEKGVDPRIGLYLAMIESEHCVCLQSPTGPLGLFQFTFATAKLHFEPSDGVIKGATISNPDIRCQPEPAARAAASYMKALTGRYGTGPASVPLAIGSYNSGEGGLSSNLQKALDANSGLPRDFWTLIANSEILSKQFQAENFKYVPKFFAAAIIGEFHSHLMLALRD
ncbi:MAG TPA: transglycosylase SLT domain-containing protein, partial [Pyrinomonadaceae bacterium]|nr:transglycosylase SLT domain-containing protein [Pyrinomonadaceae bacterium]